MYKGTVDNIRVKKDITEAFFSLLKKKNFSEITITDIAAEANVARMSYYRNFASKEEIIEQYIAFLHEDLLSVEGYSQSKDLFMRNNLIALAEHAFKCALKDKSYLLALYKNGFSSFIQETMNRYVEEMLGDMSHNSISRYKLYFFAGAAFNTQVKWLENGAVESPLAMARAFVELLEENMVIDS